MHGLVVLDENDAVLRPAILWNDQRTAAECAEIEARVGLDRLIELTGNRALTGFTAPKILWLRKHEPETYSRIRHILLPKDYVRFRLTGERAIDAADASGTLLYDVAGRRWSDEVCSALEIPLDWLPPAYESTEVAGAGDQAAAALGVGIVSPGLVSVVLGTSGVVFAVLPAYAPDPQARVHVFCHAVPGTWHAMGVMLSAAGSFAWLRHVLGAGYGVLDEEAERWEPGVEGLLFAPYLAGERTPHPDPDARGALTGSLASPRPRGTRPRDPGGRRLRPARLARAAALARRPRRGRPRVGRRRPQRALAEDRRVGPRDPARKDRVGGGLGVRRRAARRRSLGRLRGRRRGRQPLRPRARSHRAGQRLERGRTSTATSATACSTRP